jgi:hypothetical protein
MSKYISGLLLTMPQQSLHQWGSTPKKELLAMQIILQNMILQAIC